MKVAIIGMGLIGGSLALSLKKHQVASHVIGVENNPAHAKIAMQRGLADTMEPLVPAIEKAQIIFLAVPVDVALVLLPLIMPLVKEGQVVSDTGSTKSAICKLADTLPHRPQFVAAHPMWGTENSGPQSASEEAFTGRTLVIGEAEKSGKESRQIIENIYTRLGMPILYMHAADHDLHAAYISHVSHIAAYALANTVLEKERDDDTIFQLASAGFESTVRLAKSHADMWVPIFKQNKENVLDVLNEHISQLRKFKSCLEKENYILLHQLILQANKVRRILK